MLCASVLAGCGGGGGDGAAGNAEPARAPGAFAVTELSAGNGSLTVSWTAAPAATGFQVTYGRDPAAQGSRSAITTAQSVTIDGLNNGFAYSVAVTASNAAGTALAVAAAPVVPLYRPSFNYRCLRNFHVATNGSDANDGSSAAQAYATVDVAVSRADLRGGDCINVAPGTYTETVVLAHGGSAASATGYVVLRSSVPLGAKLRPPSGAYSTVNLMADYLVVDGFDVQGGPGSAIDGCIESPSGRHHLAVLNNVAHDAGLSGISMCEGDYFHVEGNVVARNSGTSIYQGSGISIYQARANSDAASGFHIVVRNNIAYANIIGLACDRCHTDGNGIIVDDFRNAGNTTGPWAGVVYPYATLVENNLVFGNGGKGLLVYSSDHVTVRNNTAFHNNLDPQMSGEWRGELVNSSGSDNLWINNIGVADPLQDSRNKAILDAAAGAPNVGVAWQSNLAYAGGSAANLVGLENSATPVTAAAGNLLGPDPLFVAPSNAPAAADFRLKAASPALGSGQATPNPDTLNGIARSATRPDRGAY
jgi:serralysin